MRWRFGHSATHPQVPRTSGRVMGRAKRLTSFGAVHGRTVGRRRGRRRYARESPRTRVRTEDSSGRDDEALRRAVRPGRLSRLRLCSSGRDVAASRSRRRTRRGWWTRSLDGARRTDRTYQNNNNDDDGGDGKFAIRRPYRKGQRVTSSAASARWRTGLKKTRAIAQSRATFCGGAAETVKRSRISVVTRRGGGRGSGARAVIINRCRGQRPVGRS